MITVVMRRLPATGGTELIPGQLVDSTSFKWEALLISQGYLRPATQREIDTAEEVDEEEAVPRVVPPRKPPRIPKKKSVATR